MPKVIVTAKPEIYNESGVFVLWMKGNVRELVARYLGVPGTQAELSISDIGVRFEIVGPNDISDYDFEVEINANDYPERRLIASNGVKAITDSIYQALGREFRFFVWLQMSYGVFEDTA